MIGGRPESLTDSLIVKRLAGFLDRVLSRLSELRSELGKTAKQTEDLIPEKRSERLAEVLSGLIAKLSAVIGTEFKNRQGAVDSARQLMLEFSEPPVTEDAAEAVRVTGRQVEIRALLRGMSGALRVVEIDKAARRGDLTWFHAVIDSPDALLEGNEEVFQRLRVEAALAAFPWLKAMERDAELTLRSVTEVGLSSHLFASREVLKLDPSRINIKADLRPIVEASSGMGLEKAA